MKKYRLGLYEKAVREEFNICEKLKLAKNAGFDFLEISIDESDEKIARLDTPLFMRKDVKDCMTENNFYIESMCLSAQRKYPLGSKDYLTRQKSIEILEKAVIFARDLGIRIIQLAGYDVYYEQSDRASIDNFEKSLKHCVEFASRFGVILAFETMENEFMNTVKKAMNYVEKINSPFLQIYPDTGNITNSGVDIEKDILSGKGHIVSAHLKETKPNIFREVKFGEGQVDFYKAVKSYKKINCTRFLAEMWDNKKDNWKDEIVNANIFLRKYLDSEFEK